MPEHRGFCLAQCRLTDEQEVFALGRKLSELLEQPDCRELVVSLEGAEGVGSALVGKLIALHKKAEATGRRLVLCGIEPHLYGALKDARLTELFHIRD
jgi:anti-anti-sigma factor